MSRRADLDLGRALAIVGVIAVHAAAGSVLRGPDEVPASGYAVALSFDAMGRVAVPVFLAIAGWVLLAGKPVATPRDLYRRAWRIVLALATWTLVYALWAPVWESSPWNADLVAIPRAVLGEPAAPHLWYLYAYIPLLLVLGSVTLLVRRIVPWLALAGVGVAAAIPASVSLVAAHAGWHMRDQEWGLPLYVLGYALLGAAVFALSRPLSHHMRVVVLAALVAWTAGMVALAYAIGYQGVFAYATVFVAVQAVLACLTLNGVQVPARLARPVASLAEASFGVYLVHLLVLQALTLVLGRASHLVGGVQAWWSIPLLTVATLAISWALASGWARIGLRKVLG